MGIFVNKLWIETDIGENYISFTDKILNKAKNEMNGIVSVNSDEEIFWADEIKKYKDVPDKRLKIALANLPIPGAFTEAGIALRSLIKIKRKSNYGFEDELIQLYDIACVYSFMLDYSKKLEAPGFNIMERVPGKYLFSLSKEYCVIGYEKLSLLTKTDVKMIKELWGGPKSHQSMNELYAEIWKKYEQELFEEKIKSREEFVNYLKNI